MAIAVLVISLNVMFDLNLIKIGIFLMYHSFVSTILNQKKKLGHSTLNLISTMLLVGKISGSLLRSEYIRRKK